MTDWFDEVYEGSVRYGVSVKQRLYRGKSAYQAIEVIDTDAYGRALVIDGVLMTSERDEFFYHEMLVHPAAVLRGAAPRKALIIGGGDGGTVREVLRHPSIERVVMVEIDEMVVAACREFLPAIGTAFEDPRLELVIGDGIAYVAEERGELFDLIFVDGTDPVGPAKGLFNRAFYDACARRLTKGGRIALQSESPILMSDLFFEILDMLGQVFLEVKPYYAPVPLYGAGMWSFTLAGAALDPLAVDPVRQETIAEHCRYYTADIHRAAFAQPRFVVERRKVLG